MPKVQQTESGGGSRGRRGRAHHVSTSLAEINVIPLVDVMLVLLIIFMVAAPMMQQGLEVNLPQARRAQPLDENRITVSVATTYRADRRVGLNDESIPLDALHERMRQAMLNREEKEVFLRGDGGVMLQELMEVMDRLKEGGVERVGLLSRPPER